MELLEKNIAENNFLGKSSMGNLFREKLKADSVERAKYEALDTAAEQLAFRLSWCKGEAASLTARRDRSKTTTWARRDLARFRYKPFGAMVVEWGGWGCADALKGATAAAAKCVSMGPPWAKLHPQSGLMEYAVVEQCWEEEYAVCWQETQNELLGTVQVDAVADDNTRGVDTAVDGGHAEAPSAPADVAHATGAPSSRAKAKATSPKPPMAKKAKREAVDDAETTLAGLFKEASRVRTMFVQATTAAEELSSMIRSGGRLQVGGQQRRRGPQALEVDERVARLGVGIRAALHRQRREDGEGKLHECSIGARTARLHLDDGQDHCDQQDRQADLERHDSDAKRVTSRACVGRCARRRSIVRSIDGRSMDANY